MERWRRVWNGGAEFGILVQSPKRRRRAWTGGADLSQPTAIPDPLTPRELEVLLLLAAGLRNRDIAARLVISEYTAANHVRSILMKTGSRDRSSAIVLAYQSRLARAPD